MKPLKVWKADRTVRKAIVVNSYEEILEKGELNFGLKYIIYKNRYSKRTQDEKNRFALTLHTRRKCCKCRIYIKFAVVHMLFKFEKLISKTYATLQIWCNRSDCNMHWVAKLEQIFFLSCVCICPKLCHYLSVVFRICILYDLCKWFCIANNIQ